MPAVPARCSKRECHITGYDVLLTDGGATIDAIIVDDCGTLTQKGLAKQILLKAIQDYLTALPSTESVYQDHTSLCPCPTGSANVDFFYGDLHVEYTTAETKPVSPTTVTIALPLTGTC